MLCLNVGQMHLHFHLDRFDGPLGLLLYLIRKEEMDIFDINIFQITDQYLGYIKSLKNLDLEMAGEFVAMAATLIHIKSKMLLPNYTDSAEDEAQEDPRKVLVQRLLEYQKFKSAADSLNKIPMLNRDLWVREGKVDLQTMDEEAIEVSDRPLFSLIHAYRLTLHRIKKTVHKVGGALQSIAQRISELKSLLRVGVRREFGELVPALPDGSIELQRGGVLITFLSLLELAKMGFIQLFQSANESPIYVDTRREIVDDLLNGIEDYESAPQDELEMNPLLLMEQPEPVAPSNGQQELFIADESATDEEIAAAELELALQEPAPINEEGPNES